MPADPLSPPAARRPIPQALLLELLGPTPTLPSNPLARLYKAIMLAPSIEVCEALLRAEPVPTSALDPVWARRYGIR